MTTVAVDRKRCSVRLSEQEKEDPAFADVERCRYECGRKKNGNWALHKTDSTQHADSVQGRFRGALYDGHHAKNPVTSDRHAHTMFTLRIGLRGRQRAVRRR